MNIDLFKEIRKPLLDYDIYKHYDGGSGYVAFEKWEGGFNNIRMSLELALCIAYISNRTLLLPQASDYYLLDGVYGYEDFFELDLIKIKWQYFDDPFLESNKDSTFFFTEKSDNCIYNFTQVPVPESLLKGRQEVRFKDYLTLDYREFSTWFFDRNLLGTFDNVIYSDFQDELKHLIKTNLVYREELYSEAAEAISKLPQKYYAVHLRRNDFQYTHTFIGGQQFKSNIEEVIPSGSTLFVASDLNRTDEFWDSIKGEYELVFQEDLIDKKAVPFHWEPMLDQLICIKAELFIGAAYSTLSSYIYRLRKYLNRGDVNYYVGTEKCSIYNSDTTLKDDQNFIASWYREYEDIAYITNQESIFISIASYKDEQIFKTLDSLFENCTNLDRIEVGVNFQDTESQLAFYEKELQLKWYGKYCRCLYTLADTVKGVAQVRNDIVNLLYSNHDYFLQIDSHTSFKKNWDNILITQYKGLGNNRAVITTYINEFTLESDKHYKLYPYNSGLVVDHHLDYFNNLIQTTNTPPLSPYTVLKSKWVSAHFLFAPKEWVQDVRIPDSIIFKGEEDLLTYLTYLKGYDVLLPSEAVVWHLYFKDKDKNVYDERVPSNLDEASATIAQTLKLPYFSRTLSDLENHLSIKLTSRESSLDLSNLHLLTWSIGVKSDDVRFSKHLQSIRLNGGFSRLVGTNLEFEGLKDKVKVLDTVLKDYDNEDVLVCLDGFDTLLVRDVKTLYREYLKYECDILFSAEKLYSWHWLEHKDKYDELPGPYRYLNSGCFMGKVGSIKKMVKEVLVSSKWKQAGSEQELYGQWVHDNMSDRKLVKLDTNCTVFWNLSEDWDWIRSRFEEGKTLLTAPNNSKPCIIHNPSNWNHKDVYHLMHREINL